MRTAETAASPHPRTIGWLGTTALAMGGSNQSLFLISALIVGQGSGAIPLLIVGLLLSWAAAPGWTELILMWPNRVGGIAATCAEAFRPYSPVLANLTGVCYWWGWVPTCGLTAILSATAIHDWYLPGVPVPALAVGLVLLFAAVNLRGVAWATRLAIPIASASALLAFLSALGPIVSGHVDWHQATSFQLHIPFTGPFGAITSAMAGLYLIGFGAPAFEAAACHVGETVNPARNVPRAMFASGAMAAVYFVLLPIVWLGVLGLPPLMDVHHLQRTLWPTFAPLFGTAAHAAALWFMMFNMFHGTLQPLAGAARTLMQLAEDGLLPRVLALRNRNDAPWVATGLTATMAILFLLGGDPVWVIAAANLCYLIGIALPSVAVWLLRRDAPAMERPYRAPRGTIMLGLIAAIVWGLATVLGFEQFGLPTVLASMALAYSGSALYAWRRLSDRRRAGLPVRWRSLHLKLTGAMLLVLGLDGAGYYLAVTNLTATRAADIAALQDIFVAVALLTISVGLVLPGMIGHAVGQVAQAADRLATGTVADLAQAMRALDGGDLDAAHASADATPVTVHTRDEVGAMAASFNMMQDEVAQIVVALDGAREGLRRTRDALTESNAALNRAYAAQGQDLAQRVTELGWLRDISRRINAAHSLDAMLDIVYDGIRDGLGYDRVGIQLFDQDRGVFEQRRGTDAQGRKTCPTDRVQTLDEDSPLWRSPGIAHVLRGAEFYYMANAVAETPPDQRHLLDGEPAHNLTVPLHVGALVTGMISVDNLLSGRPIAPDDAVPLLALANQVGTAVENARLLERAQAAREAAERARAVAEDALRVRDSFLLAASHDLRTPLTNIVGRADLMGARLEGDELPPAAWLRTQVGSLRGTARRMVATVEEITDAAHLQMGQTLTLRSEEVDVGTLVEVMARSVAEIRMRGSAVPIDVDVHPDVIVIGDRARLERVVQNIIENAVKYSPAATPVHVTVERRGERAVIAVRDCGVGIPADELPRIFTHFYRASTALGAPGAGLGLAGAKTIVEQHGGAIGVESAVGQGTTVTVTLPCRPPVAQPGDAGDAGGVDVWDGETISA